MEQSKYVSSPDKLDFEKPSLNINNEVESLSSTICQMTENIKDYVLLLISAEKETAHMRQLANTDPLTGVRNKLAYDERIDAMNAIISKGCMDDFGIIMMDINLLKKINDTYGHTEGDTAIITVGRALCTACGSEAVCARFGGDEFAAAVIIHKQQAASWFTQFSDLFSRFISDYNATSGKPYQIMASVGFSTETCSKTMNIEALINKADSQMYAEKDVHKRTNQ
jgi:diguanylate cyclase (GGDEF)-like protein